MVTVHTPAHVATLWKDPRSPQPDNPQRLVDLPRATRTTVAALVAMRARAMLELLAVVACIAHALSACAVGVATGDLDERVDSETEAERDVLVPRRDSSPEPARRKHAVGPPPPSPVERVDEQESAPALPPRPRARH